MEMRHQLPSVHKARRTSSGLYHQRNTEEVIAEWKTDNSLMVAIRVPTLCTVWPQTQPSCVMLIQSTGTTRDRENTQGAAAHMGKMNWRSRVSSRNRGQRRAESEFTKVQ